MRIFERLQILTTLMLTVTRWLDLDLPFWPLVLLSSIVITYLGVDQQGVHLAQVPCFIAQVLNLMSLVGIRRVDLLAVTLVLNSILLVYFYGEIDLKPLGTPKGPFAIGFKRVFAKNGQQITCYYPIHRDNWQTLK